MPKIKTSNKKKDINFQDGVDLFLRYCKIKNLSPETIYYYTNCSLFFLEFCKKEYNVNEFLCKNITQDNILDYIEYLQNKVPPIKDVTINSYLKGLRAILKYLMEKNHCKSFKIELIKQEETIKETYNDSEIKTLLKKPKDFEFWEIRTWAMTALFLATGIRISSALNIKISDVDLKDNVLIITKAKNRKQQIIPFSNSLNKVLTEYLDVWNYTPEHYLFPNQFEGQLKRRSAEQCIKRYNNNRGVDKTSAHLYRHTFAKLWILNGGDLFTLQKILGHSSLEIVKKYVNIFSNELNMIYQQYNPLDGYIKNNETIKINK